MNPDDTTPQAIIDLARGLRDLQQQAAQQYEPVLDDILRTRSQDIRHIVSTSPAVRVSTSQAIQSESLRHG